MKKYLTGKNIGYLSITLGALGLIHELVGLVLSAELDLPFLHVLGHLKWFAIINVQFFMGSARFSSWFVGFNLFFYFLLLLGGLLFLKYPFREIRLLRFIYAFVFAKCAMGICTTIIWFLIEKQVFLAQVQQDSNFWFYLVFGQVETLLLAYISFQLFTCLGEGRKLQYTERVIGEQTFTKYTEATLWQRFAHLLIDLLLSILIFGPLVFLLGPKFLEKIRQAMGERTTIYLVVLLCRLLYYLFFEGVFSATPSKYLTETRVANADGEKITFGTAVIRSICRHIPFEPFSAFTRNAWHDQLSDSYVYKEQVTGVVKASNYVWLLAVFVVLMVGAPFSVSKLEDYGDVWRAKYEYNAKVRNMKRLLEHPATDQLYWVAAYPSDYSQAGFYLKVEEVRPHSILFSSLKSLTVREDHIREAENAYIDHKDNLAKYEISKEALAKAITEDYSDYRQGNYSASDLLKNGQKYTIGEIDCFTAPVIRGSSGASQSNNTISLSFNNYGAAGKVVAIINDEGTDIKWEGLPIDIEAAPATESYSAYRQVTVYGTGYQYQTSYKFKMIVEDPSGRKSTYEVSGFHLNRTIVRID